jgi:hypothetical protein
VNYVEEKAVWEYMVCMLALFLATVCYVGWIDKMLVL